MEMAAFWTHYHFCAPFYTYSYDFDRDGYVIQDDVRLILSHVPIENTVAGHVAKEGQFTSAGGGR